MPPPALGYTGWHISRIIGSYEFRIRFNAVTHYAMVSIYVKGLVKAPE